MVKKFLLILFIIFTTINVITSDEQDKDKNEQKNYCKLTYHITNDFDYKEIKPDQITINDKSLINGERYPPGNYTIIIEKEGFHRKKSEIGLLSSEEIYILREVLETKPRIVRAQAKTSFPSSGSPIPDVFLNGKNIHNSAFKPGRYQMVIQCHRYKTIQKEIMVKPGEDVCFIGFYLLEPTPRGIHIDLRYNIPPKKLDGYDLDIFTCVNTLKSKIDFYLKEL